MANKLFKRTEFATNVLTLMTGTAIAQAIPIAISPILTRIYSPDDFGVLGLYMAIVSIIAVAAAGRYEMAIMLPKKDEDALNIVALSVIITFFVSLLVLLLVIIFQNSLIYLFVRKFQNVTVSEIRFLLYIIPVSIFFISLYQIFNYWSTRQKTFKRNATAKVSQSVMYSASALGLKMITKGSAGLVIGNLSGYITAAMVLTLKILRNLKNYLPFINKASIKENARKYKAFPIVNAPPAVLSSMQTHGILFITAYFFSSFVVGCYSFVVRIMHIPIELIGSSMYQVFYQKASTLYNNNENIQPVVKKLYIRSFLIGLPIFGAILIGAPTVFAFVFGEEWRYAGELGQIITPWLFLNFIASPISSLPLITNNQKKAMYFVIIDISLRFITLTAGGFIGSFKIAIAMTSLSCCIVLVVALIWYYRLSSRYYTRPLPN